jgi:hypothetical protein
MFARACTERTRKASALRRIEVVTVAVPLADSTVPSVDEELRTLVAGNLAAAVNRLALGSVDRGGPLSALGFHGPPAIAGDHMLATAFGHFTSPCCRLATLMLPAGHAYQPIGSIA